MNLRDFYYFLNKMKGDKTGRSTDKQVASLLSGSIKGEFHSTTPQQALSDANTNDSYLMKFNSIFHYLFEDDPQLSKRGDRSMMREPPTCRVTPQFVPKVKIQVAVVWAVLITDRCRAIIVWAVKLIRNWMTLPPYIGDHWRVNNWTMDGFGTWIEA